MTIPPPANNSPVWGATTKLVVALTFVAVVAALLVRFQFILGPLVIALVLSYLIHPVANLLRRAHLSWQLSVTLIYLLILVLLFGLLALGGVGLVQQVQSVVKIAQDGLAALPGLIQNFSGQDFQFGPFQIDFRTLDLNQLSQQVLGMVEPLLSRTGVLLSAVASSAAGFFGWTLFVLLLSYFVLIESGGLRSHLFGVDIPGYSDDIARLSRELGRIWNAFLRGQFIIFFLTVVVYTVVLTILGVHYAIGLAFLAGLARFVPYVGPFINWTVLVLVSYFQDFKLFGWPPLTYTIIVFVVAFLVDQTFDNFVSPRILAQALKVHPAAVLVAAIIAANLLGLLGVVIAAPILATVTLFFRYTMRKMLDLNPWPENEPLHPPPLPGSRFMVQVRRLWRTLWRSRERQS
ncbi:MAG TPA: AI-2E family transporter [Anaerolineales bacterium]|nr:AI-2E family transporter [Anaerolineales bacterium]